MVDADMGAVEELTLDTGDFKLYTDRNVLAIEVANLMASVGWGAESDYDPAAVERSLSAYAFVAYARDPAGQLVGYVTAFSDGAFSTFIGELVVRPGAQRRGLGSALLRRVEEQFPGIPVYVQSFTDVNGFFQRRGYRVGQRPMGVLFKIPGPEARHTSVAGSGIRGQR